MLHQPKPSPFEAFAAACRELGLPAPVAEYEFAAPVRDWRFDACWPSLKIAVEFDGAVWAQGRHTRGAGFLADHEKLNEAAIRGWLVLRFESKRAGEAKTMGLVRRAMGVRTFTPPE